MWMILAVPAFERVLPCKLVCKLPISSIFLFEPYCSPVSLASYLLGPSDAPEASLADFWRRSRIGGFVLPLWPLFHSFQTPIPFDSTLGFPGEGPPKKGASLDRTKLDSGGLEYVFTLPDDGAGPGCVYLGPLSLLLRSLDGPTDQRTKMWPLWKAEMVAAKAKCVSRQFHVLDISLASTMGAIEKEEVFIDAASLALFDGHLNGPSLMFLIPWVSM
jgi:hypothetical protein